MPNGDAWLSGELMIPPSGSGPSPKISCAPDAGGRVAVGAGLVAVGAGNVAVGIGGADVDEATGTRVAVDAGPLTGLGVAVAGGLVAVAAGRVAVAGGRVAVAGGGVFVGVRVAPAGFPGAFFFAPSTCATTPVLLASAENSTCVMTPVTMTASRATPAAERHDARTAPAARKNLCTNVNP
jgi:hypothetical protein